MKLVFQIAGGIVLAGFLMFASAVTVTYFAAEAAKEQARKILAKQQATIQQRTYKEKLERERNARARRVLAERKRIATEKANKQAVEENKIKRVRLEQERSKEHKREKNKRAAWNEYYEQPYQCKRPDSQKMLEWCMNYNIKTKITFNHLIREGKIKI